MGPLDLEGMLAGTPLQAVSVAVTSGIRVETRSAYMAERSNSFTRRHFFRYTIRITNEGAEAARLMNRHWIIVDGMGRRKDVRGAGVVGEQPYLRPGATFQYSSACPLETTSGVMRGSYEMVRDDGAHFHVAIGPFLLVAAVMLN